eukprot:CAMPEP_0175088504 /NCGR_PEP_ID=MMETSP0086_2-20121207/284_1 /TAXON_ID=136419 /ORGANISM="Unknown Unknown, Strain D1" /LENGTH=495 /DNA_ID=CAMNT_0016360943 /DNA_START=162 /DNA_END=1649 /DNA_ORIENTATION=-
MNPIDNLWTVEALNRGKSFEFGRANVVMSGSTAYDVCLKVCVSKLTLLLDGVPLFQDLSVAKYFSKLGAHFGLSVMKAKATIKHFSLKAKLASRPNSGNRHPSYHSSQNGRDSQTDNPRFGARAAAPTKGSAGNLGGAAANSAANGEQKRTMSSFERRRAYAGFDKDTFQSGLIEEKAHQESREKGLNGLDPAAVQAIRNNVIETSVGLTFDDIAALEGAKRILKESILLPMLLPEFFTGLRQPWRGILLHGPPGTGKTMLAKAVAGSAGFTFFNVTIASIMSKWRGESEKLVQTLFNMARAHAPSIVFLDEVDALASTRGGSSEHEASRRMKSEILSQVDGLTSAMTNPCNSSRVIVLATTNRPWDLDEAFRRRLEKRIYVPLPNHEAREEIFRIFTRDSQLTADVSLKELSDMTDGFSGADIHSLCRDWAMEGVRRLIAGKSPQEILALDNSPQLRYPLSMDQFLCSRKKASPSVAAAEIKQYQEWQALYGST